MVNIKIITGSVRPTRFNLQVAEWLFGIARKRKDAKVELLDLAKIKLPFLDEPQSPMHRAYTKPYTKQWSKVIDASDGFVWVTPEYNHSVSPVLKNAIDFLYHEWNWKPVALASYGGGAGGSRAAEHLRAVAGELKMYDLREQILLPNYWNHLDKNGKYQFTKEQAEEANELFDSLVFWSAQMESARATLQKKQ